MWRGRLEAAGIFVALLLCGAFLVSFIFGLRTDRPTAAANPASAVEPEPAQRSLGRLEVLNASGRAGLARAATDRLRQAGFDVVYFGNAGAAAGDTSVVLDRAGDDAVARAAARHLGIDRVATRVDTTLFVDASVIIGSDWRSAPMAPAVEVQPGWRDRLSRWLRPGS